MNNEPVAWMQVHYKDNRPTKFSPVKVWEDDIPLYTHPVKELNDGGEPVKNATYWKRQYNEMSAANDRLKSGLYHANEQIKYLESHPVKELTQGEIHAVWASGSYYTLDKEGNVDEIRFKEFAKAILRKAQSKPSRKCGDSYDTVCPPSICDCQGKAQ